MISVEVLDRVEPCFTGSGREFLSLCRYGVEFYYKGFVFKVLVSNVNSYGLC